MNTTLVWLLFALCCLLTLLLPALAFIRPLRWAAARAVARLLRRQAASPLLESALARLFVATGLTLLPLCSALRTDASFAAWFPEQSNAAYSLSVALAVALQALWNTFCVWLWTRRNRGVQARRWRRNGRLVLLMLLPFLLIAFAAQYESYMTVMERSRASQQEPLFPPDVRLELDELRLAIAKRPDSPEKVELLNFTWDYVQTGNASARSPKPGLSMLELAIRHQKPLLEQYIRTQIQSSTATETP